jgi:hypothetical protein
MTTPAAPDPQTVSHEAVATVARERVLALTEEVLLRDAKIREQQQYIQHLQSKLQEATPAPPRPRPMPPAGDVETLSAKG